MTIVELFETQSNIKTVFHETAIPNALKILTDGSIAPLYDHSPHMKQEYEDIGAFGDDDDLLNDYGAWVYTSAFTWNKNYSFFGTNVNDVMFVIDATQIVHNKKHTPNKEGGLVAVKGSIPISHISYVTIRQSNNPSLVGAIKQIQQICQSQAIPCQIVDSSQYEQHRISIIDKFKG